MTGTPFDLAGPLPSGRVAIEASAGTGKTYTITGLIVRYLANGDVGVDELLVVTFTRAAVNELRDRTRSLLRRAVAVVGGEPVPASDPWLSTLLEGGEVAVAGRLRRLHDALARFDEATVTTIHGFCQLALIHGGVRAGVDPGAELVEDGTDLVTEVCRDVLVRRLADSPYRLSTTARGINATSFADAARPPRKVETDLRAAVATVLAHPLARLDPADSAIDPAGAWHDAVVEATNQVRARRRARRQIGYDDLVTELINALEASGGDQLATQLARRFPLVLVDEFQDTDPAQWHIFSAVFGRGRLVTVGDPKQAIYRFRGADLHAYLDAVRGAVPAGLLTNYRSDRDLLAALGVLMNGAVLGHPDVGFVAVGAPAGAPARSLPGAPMQFHLVPDDDSLLSDRGRLSAATASGVVLGDLACRVRELLDAGTAPEHIAVLVTSQAQATAVASMLRRWGIPSARARTGSVLHTDAATQWRVLLAALASPSRARVVRAAGLGWFFDLDPTTLTDDDGDQLAGLQRQLAVGADVMRTEGVGAVYERLRAETDVLDVVLGGRDGDRRLADLDQIAELLVVATTGRGTDPHRVRNILDDLVADAEDQRETTMRRVETDASAVQVTTIHAAKGLEYPVVMVPFAYSMKVSAVRPYTYAVADAGTGRHQRAVDVASWVAWTAASADAPLSSGVPSSQAQRKALATAEVFGDQQRLLYVALTRAKHQLHVWWADVASAEKSPLGRLVLDRDGDGPVLNNPSNPPKASIAAVRAQLDRLSTACAGAISVDDARLAPTVRLGAVTQHAGIPALRTAALGGRGPLRDPTWRSWSFSAIASAITEVANARGPVGTLGGDDAPAGGGADEPIEPADVELPDEPAASSADTAPVPPSAGDGPVMPPVVMALADVVAGTTFGTMVHKLLDHVDFTSPDLAASLGNLAAAGARGAGLSLDADVLATGLVAAVNTPLGPLFGGRALRDLAPSDRLSELDFDLPVSPGDGPPLDASGIAAALLDTLPADDALRPYAAALRTELAHTSMSGWLTGSIDGVFRVPIAPDHDADRATTDHRYVVVDYKTNRLHVPGDADPLAAYRPDRLVARMAEHHYPLQAVLYSVALHRYLRWRLGDRYRADRHLGGIAYLFVRGMVGSATPMVDGVPHGVFSYRLPIPAVVAIDELFERGNQ